LSSKESYEDLGDDVPFEEKDKIWDLIYKKVSEAVKRRQDFAILYSTLVGGNEEEGYSAIITKDQYEVLLRNFLVWSEEQERYELCVEVNKIIKQLESWIEKN
jgi:hypothetical protein